MNKAQWDALPLSGKVEQLHREFGAFLEHAEENRRARDELRTNVRDRLAELEKALTEMESRVAKLEGKNDA